MKKYHTNLSLCYNNITHAIVCDEKNVAHALACDEKISHKLKFVLQLISYTFI